MAYNLEQDILDLLTRFPVTRKDPNLLVLAFWIHKDGLPYKQSDLTKLTPHESIGRTAREVWKTHPELAPLSVEAEKVFTKMNDLFTGVEVVYDPA